MLPERTALLVIIKQRDLPEARRKEQAQSRCPSAPSATTFSRQGWSSSPVRASDPWRWVRSVGILLVYHALTRSNQTKRMLKQSVYAESGHTPASNCPSTGLSHPPQTPDYKVPYSSPRHQQSISSSLLGPLLANILLLMTEQRKMEVWGVSDICSMSHTRQDHMVLTKTHPSENISEKK